MVTIKRRVQVYFRQAEAWTRWEWNDWKLPLVEIKAQSKWWVPQVEDKTQKQVTWTLGMSTLVELPTGTVHLSLEKMWFLQERADILGLPVKDYIHILSIRLRPYLHSSKNIHIVDELIERSTPDFLDHIDRTFTVENWEFNLKAYDIKTVGTNIQDFVDWKRS